MEHQPHPTWYASSSLVVPCKRRAGLILDQIAFSIVQVEHQLAIKPSAKA
jgi:hypothetical protein